MQDAQVTKSLGNNSKVDLVSMNAYTKFDKILSIESQDIEGKRNYDGSTE